MLRRGQETDGGAHKKKGCTRNIELKIRTIGRPFTNVCYSPAFVRVLWQDLQSAIKLDQTRRNSGSVETFIIWCTSSASTTKPFRSQSWQIGFSARYRRRQSRHFRSYPRLHADPRRGTGLDGDTRFITFAFAGINTPSHRCHPDE